MNLLLGVTGSVAATLTPKLTRELLALDVHVELKIISTERGLYFFDRESVSALAPVLTDKDEWPESGYSKGSPVPHIDLGDWADLLLIAPLTADTLSDMAHGKADKFLTSTVLAWPREKPLVIAPAMNTRMWENPVTQRNLQTMLEVYQTTIIKPIEGKLACGVTGVGAMARIETIVMSVGLLLPTMT